MPGKHANLSPSAAKRWLTCPASIRQGAKFKNKESAYAREGTCAHALGEIKAAHHFGFINDEQFDELRLEWALEYHDVLTGEEFELDEMERHTDDYVAYLDEAMQRHPNSVLLLEQRINTGVDECWGTGDAVIVSPVHVETVDFKYGAGVRVEAEDNPQLMLYGVGALDQYGDLLGVILAVYWTVFQPRMDNVKTASCSPQELLSWRDDFVKPIAKIALGDDAPFGPSEDACRFCPASGQCRPQLDAVIAIDFADEVETLEAVKEDPELVDNEALGKALDQIPLIRRWLKDVEEVALTLLYQEGAHIPGYKVVQSGGQRKIKDSDGAIEALTMIGHSVDDVSKRSIRGIGELEKLLGKKEFASLMDPFITKTEGRPSVVPETDKRPSTSPIAGAQEDFKEEPE